MINRDTLTNSVLNASQESYSDQTWIPNRPIVSIRLTDLEDRFNRLKKDVEPVINPVIPAAPTGTPSQVTGLSATESPFRAQDGTLKSNVSVSFTVNPSDTYFDHVQIWFTGYNGNSNPQLMPGDCRTSPASFLCDTTHETVTITVVAVGSTGITADFTFAPTTTVLLDGVTSAPPAPSFSQTLVTTPTGYQFAFNQLTGLAADQIDGYRIWQNTTNNSATATQIDYVKHNPLNGTTVTLQYTAANGVTNFYWVSAVNTTGLESTKAAAQSATVTSTNPIDSGNIVVAGGVDFTRPYLNKNLDNIADSPSFVRPSYVQAKQGHGVFLETLESPITGGTFVWNARGGETGTNLTYPSDGQAGGKALAHSAATICWFAFPQNIPFDPSKMYRMRARVRKTAGANGTVFFAGVEGVAADGVTLVNVAGANSASSQHYICANSAAVAVSASWTEFTGYFKGWGTYGPSSNPNTPSGLNAAVRYIRPLFILNYSTGGDSWELDYLALDIMPDSTDNIADGTGSPLTGGKRGFNALDSGNIIVAGSVDFSRGYTGKHLGNIPDDGTSDRRAATANQLTGGTRAFSNINTDNTYATLPYHGSAFRRQTSTAEGGSRTAAAGEVGTAFVTAGSFILQIPSGYSSYKGTLSVSKTSGLASGYTIKGRLKIGSLLSNEIVIVGPTTSGSGVVTVTSITGGTQITVEVQLFIDNSNDFSHTCPASVSFGHNEYVDQDTTNLQ